MFARSQRYYDAIYRWKDYAAESHALLALVAGQRRTDSPAAPDRKLRLLDVACGTGQHLAHLRHRFTVTGVDLDAEMIAIARRRCPEIDLVVGDMVEVDLGQQFDVIACLFSSIGYLPSVERLHAACTNLARQLAPRGLLLVEPWIDPTVFRSGHHTVHLVDDDDLKIVRVSHGTVSGRVAVLDFHYLVADREHDAGAVQHFTERHELTLFTDAEYRCAFERAGLDLVANTRELSPRGTYLCRLAA